MPKQTKADQDPASLEEIASRIERVASGLRTAASSINGMGFEKLTVSNWDSLIRSMNGIESFERRVWDAYNNRRKELGHFQARSPERMCASDVSDSENRHPENPGNIEEKPASSGKRRTAKKDRKSK